MSTDSRIESDLKSLAAESARGLPNIDETARALQAARAKRGGSIMKTIRKPIWATALAGAVVAAVLLFPVPYSRTVGYELTLRKPDGRVAKVKLAARDDAQAEQRAAAFRKNGVNVTVAPRTQRVWGSVWAMAKEKILQIHVELDGKNDGQVADEIRDQLGNAGWNADDVQVSSDSNGSTVQIKADDGQGRHIEVVRKALGGGEKKMDVEVGGIDDTREPGMTDAQLRDKILKQLQARGLDGDVTVQGNMIQISASKSKTEEE
jgi:hypothetical protein